MKNRKLVAVLAIIAFAVTGASAQLMFGVSGALHMDEMMSASEIQAAFQDGQYVWYGGFAEIAFGRLGFGISGNLTAPYDGGFGTDFMDLDIAGYVSYHLFKARAFIDPFLELGGGYIGSDYANSGEDPNDNPESATLYWYGALGLGINLGPIGIFGKFAYNTMIDQPLQGEDEYGNTYDIPQYGYWYQDDLGDWVVMPTVPALRFTLGAKIIL